MGDFSRRVAMERKDVALIGVKHEEDKRVHL